MATFSGNIIYISTCSFSRKIIPSIYFALLPVTIANATTNPSRERSSLRTNENTQRSRKHLCDGENASIESVVKLRNEKKRDERRARANGWTARRRCRRSPRRCASRQTAWQLSDLFIRLCTHTRGYILRSLGLLHSRVYGTRCGRLSPRVRQYFLICEINYERVMRSILKKDRIRNEKLTNKEPRKI
jgi:hypothetical protein